MNNTRQTSQPNSQEPVEGLANQDRTNQRFPTNAMLIGFLLLALALVCLSFYPVFLRLGRIWTISPDYSHGFLVIPFASYLIYVKRTEWLPLLRSYKPSGMHIAIGLGLICGAFALRAAGLVGRALPVEGLSILILVVGIIWLLMGPRGVWINWAGIAFLIFMLPIPSHANRVIRGNLQTVATGMSIITLQTIGVPAIERGNVISLPNAEVGVVEACSGIRILVSLAAIAFGLAVLTESHWLRRVLLLVSVVPVALIANVSRIVMTAIGHEYFPARSAEIHDAAGWVMIALAVFLLILVKKFLAALLMSDEPAAKLPAGELAVR